MIKNGSTFSHLLTVRAEGADPPPPSPLKTSVFSCLLAFKSFTLFHPSPSLGLPLYETKELRSRLVIPRPLPLLPLVEPLKIINIEMFTYIRGYKENPN